MIPSFWGGGTWNWPICGLSSCLGTSRQSVAAYSAGQSAFEKHFFPNKIHSSYWKRVVGPFTGKSCPSGGQNRYRSQVALEQTIHCQPNHLLLATKNVVSLTGRIHAADGGAQANIWLTCKGRPAADRPQATDTDARRKATPSRQLYKIDSPISRDRQCWRK